jgi:hypothetical protein
MKRKRLSANEPRIQIQIEMQVMNQRHVNETPLKVMVPLSPPLFSGSIYVSCAYLKNALD